VYAGLSEMRVVGVDLDLTMIDTRAAASYALSEVSRRCGYFIDTAEMVRRMGPPLREELARWMPSVSVEATGIEAAAIVGGVTGPEKVKPLIDIGAEAYIGDHPLDMGAARGAGVVGIGVTTGSFDRAELTGAGADWVVDSLLEFVSVLR
jgi:phosphoglycolate phosphatase